MPEFEKPADLLEAMRGFSSFDLDKWHASGCPPVTEGLKGKKARQVACQFLMAVWTSSLDRNFNRSLAIGEEISRLNKEFPKLYGEAHAAWFEKIQEVWLEITGRPLVK